MVERGAVAATDASAESQRHGKHKIYFCRRRSGMTASLPPCVCTAFPPKATRLQREKSSCTMYLFYMRTRQGLLWFPPPVLENSIWSF